MCFDVENECIKEKISRMSHDGFFYQEHKRNLFLKKNSWMLFFMNTSNAKLLGLFYK
jgi:hypothetical protein